MSKLFRLILFITLVSIGGALLPNSARADAALYRNIESGMWWNDQEPGRGYFIDQRDDQLFFISYLYDAAGKATWYYSTLTQSAASPNTYSGSLTLSSMPPATGGQASAAAASSVGALKITFDGPASAALTWLNLTPKSIRRFQIADRSLATARADGVPANGIWWSNASPGIGYGVDIQGQNIVFLSAAYRADGSPFWCLAAGTFGADGQFSASMTEYAGGSPLGTPHNSPHASASCGNVTLRFISTSAIDAIIGAAPPARLRPFEFSSRPKFLGLVRAEGIAADQVRLAWLPASSPLVATAAIAYDIYRLASVSEAPSSANLAMTVTGTTGATITGLSPDTRHFFSVIARLPTGVQSLPLPPLEVSTLVVSQTLAAGVTVNDVAAYGLQSAVLRGTMLVAVDTARIPPAGTILAGSIESGPFLGRILGGSIQGSSLVIQTQPVSLADVYESGGMNLAIQAVDGNAAMDALDAAYGPGGAAARTRATRSARTGSTTMEEVEWVEEGMTFYVDRQRATFQRGDRAAVTSGKLAAIRDINEIFKAVEITVTDFDVGTSLNHSLQWSGRKLKAGSFVSVRGAVRMNVAVDVTLKTFKAGFCSKLEREISIPLNAGLYVLPTPLGVPIPVPYYVDIYATAGCEAKLRALAKGTGVLVRNVDYTYVWDGSGWNASPPQAPSFTQSWGFSDGGVGSGKADVSASLGLGIRYQAGYTKSVLSGLTSDYGVGIVLPVMLTTALYFTAEAAPMPPGVPISWGPLDFKSLDLGGKQSISFIPAVELISTQITPLKIVFEIASLKFFGLPTKAIRTDKVTQASFRLVNISDNGSSNNVDYANTRWSALPVGNFRLAQDAGIAVVATSPDANSGVLGEAYARIIGEASSLVPSVEWVTFGVNDDVCFGGRTKLSNVSVNISGYRSYSLPTNEIVRANCPPKDYLVNLTVSGSKEYKRSTRDNAMLEFLSNRVIDISYFTRNTSVPKFLIQNDNPFYLDCGNPSPIDYALPNLKDNLGFFGIFDVATLQNFAVGKALSLRGFGWEVRGYEYTGKFVFNDGQIIVAENNLDVTATITGLSVTFYNIPVDPWPLPPSIYLGPQPSETTYKFNVPIIWQSAKVNYEYCKN